MNTISCLRVAIMAAFLSTALLSAQAQNKQAPVVAREGFWVVETPAKGQQCTVRFYDNQRTLIYQETLDHRLNLARRHTKRNLNAALEQAIFVWNATHKLPTDRQWVAIQFDKN
jgi:hypothetical protein